MALRIINGKITDAAPAARSFDGSLDPDLLKIYQRSGGKVALWHPDHNHPVYGHTVYVGDIDDAQEVIDKIIASFKAAS